MEMCNECIKQLVRNYTAKKATTLDVKNMIVEPYTEVFSDNGTIGDVFVSKKGVFYYGDIIFTDVDATSILIGEQATSVQPGSNIQFQNLLFSSLSDGGTAKGIFIGKKITANSSV